MPFLTGYTLRKAITIDHTHVDSDLTDFPLLVKFTDDADIGAAIDAGGLNIRFTTSDGETLLKYERQSFDNGGSTATGVFWVKVPTIAGAANTEIYVYYKGGAGVDGSDPTNVWDINFAAVWHMEQDPSGSAPQILDSTSNAEHGTSFGSMSSGDLVAGQVGYELDFESGEGLNIAGVTIGDPVTISGVIKPAANGSFATIIASGSTGLYYRGVVKKIHFYNSSMSADALTEGVRQHFAVTMDAGAVAYYLNGLASGTGAAANTFTATKIANDSVGDPFVGALDELRVSSVSRSATWLKFEYRNIFEADNEISFGAEEEDAGGGTFAEAVGQSFAGVAASGSATAAGNIAGTALASGIENGGGLDALADASGSSIAVAQVHAVGQSVIEFAGGESISVAFGYGTADGILGPPPDAGTGEKEKRQQEPPLDTLAEWWYLRDEIQEAIERLPITSRDVEDVVRLDGPAGLLSLAKRLRRTPREVENILKAFPARFTYRHDRQVWDVVRVEIPKRPPDIFIPPNRLAELEDEAPSPVVIESRKSLTGPAPSRFSAYASKRFAESAQRYARLRQLDEAWLLAESVDDLIWLEQEILAEPLARYGKTWTADDEQKHPRDDDGKWTLADHQRELSSDKEFPRKRMLQIADQILVQAVKSLDLRESSHVLAGKARSVVGKIPNTALRLLLRNTSQVRLYRSPKEITSALKEIDPDAESAAAFYDHDTGILHLNGALETGADIEYTLEEVYAHEFSHAIDKGHHLSTSADWKAAWQEELSTGEFTDRSAESTIEGWADFGVIAFLSPTDTQRQFPMCWKVWQNQGLVAWPPKRTRNQRSTRSTQTPLEASRR